MFTYLKKFSKVKSNIGPLRNDDDELVSDPKDKAEMLSKQYASVFSTPCEINETDLRTRPSHSLNDINFNEDDIVASIDELRINSAAFCLAIQPFFSKSANIYWQSLYISFGDVVSMLEEYQRYLNVQ